MSAAQQQRGLPVLISERFSTDDPAEAAAGLQQVLPGVRVTAIGGPFGCSWSSHGADGTVLVELHVDAAASIDGAVLHSPVLGLVLGGSCTVVAAGAEVDVARPFLLQPGPVRVATAAEGFDAVVVVMEDADLRLGGAGPARSADADAVWIKAVRTARSVLAVPQLLANDLVRTTTLEMLREAAVVTFGAVPDPGAGARIGTSLEDQRARVELLRDRLSEVRDGSSA